jgi:hypothetical protein
MTAPVEHGTKRGYAAHLRAEEKPCVECTAANADSVQGHKIRCGKQATLRVPVEALGLMLLHLDEDVLDRISDQLGHEATAACMDVASWDALKNSETKS